MNRRNFFGGAAMTAVAAASVSRVAMAALPEPVMMGKPDTAPPLVFADLGGGVLDGAMVEVAAYTLERA